MKGALSLGCCLQIYGIRYGLRGFYSRDAKPMELNAQAVEGIHLQGGTLLVSRWTAPDTMMYVVLLCAWPHSA